MSRLQTSFVLGYHGCDRSIADRAVLHCAALLQSNKDYDWLGPGAYFWESDPKRALQWAHWKAGKGDYEKPAVIGAVIDLENCLDLVTQEGIEILSAAHQSFRKVRKLSDLPMPTNRSPKGMKDKDRILRYLDNAVFRHLHSIIDTETDLPPFDTVRAMFVEGGRVYPGSGLHRKSHIQIAVRNSACIKGIFFPTDTTP